MRSRNWQRWVLGAIVLAALSLRLGFLNRPFWIDESFSATLATLPLRKVIELCWVDVHPPGYFIVLKEWNALGCRLTGRDRIDEPWTVVRFDLPQLSTTGLFTFRRDDATTAGMELRTSGIFPEPEPPLWREWRLMPLPYLRLPSALAGVVCVALVWFVAARLYPGRPAIRALATLLMAVSPHRITWDTVIRDYAWVSVFVLAAALIGLWGADRGRWRIAGPALALAVAAALLCHYTALLALPFLALALWRRSGWRARGVLGGASIGAGLLLAAAVWGRAFLHQRAAFVQVNDYDPANTFALLLTQLQTTVHYFWQFVFSYGVADILNPHASLWYYPAFLLYAAGLGAAVYGMWKSPDPSDWAVVWLAFGPAAIILAANVARPFTFLARHFYPFAPFFFIFLAMGWSRIVERGVWFGNRGS